ncbi:MAG TPA: penicillin-binding transpeptidase domain-containing protein [Phycisphaerae bacterium]|nr:penicillin-binding transpeptidase domain-containing protein [Phycisphaerae bacterium]HOJ73901.1 penicillin-binding transpeptidase domain-containing protein [Phycisphaerae bacterium]HOM50842.1 penicillin-binding transpeptidase domain-containing protein [Phycisphaerae bacterium]HOQ86768.1 penicillin-binding transpeptidase domain-containing protein [Phycisphaerae bacterium]HPP25983.1 penicillin-binding transpeptidase domain-containing protein [Phycisphaerae bacterium]
MFEHRIKLLLMLFALPALVLVGRLFQLQVVQASAFREETHEMLQRPPRQLACLRGRIFDRAGRLLAYDDSAWDISVHYAAIVNDPAARRRMCKLLKLPADAVTDERIEESWERIAQLSAKSRDDLRREAQRIERLVKRIKNDVSEKRGMEILIEEELSAHPVVSGLDRSQQVAARVALSEYPWIDITASHRRVYDGGTAMNQILGQLGRVTAEALAADPFADDHLAKYQSDDFIGILGVERLAENWLRGRRGEEYKNRLGQEVKPPVQPRDGRDVQLTIDFELQKAVYGQWTLSSIGMGGAAVILDIPTRNVLAMVGYPAVDPHDPDDVRRNIALRDNPRRPFLFRAVRGNYHPGSIVKPMILAAGMTERIVGPNDTVNCIGRLFESYGGWGCEGIHPHVSAVEAIQKSCNVYFYRLGQQLGVEREAKWMQMFGLGRPSGTGLVEDFRGRLPMRKNDGEARLAAIGQGEIELTPIQAANLIATVADGKFRPVTLWANNPNPHPPAHPLPVSQSTWETVREGLYRAVNVHGGTAYKKAGHVDFGPYVLMGKTGSAETGPPEWIYPITLPDGKRYEVRAPDARAVRRLYPDAQIHDENKRCPPEYEQTHSWFVGYLAPRGRYKQPVGPGPASVAIAVIVEHAGHGGDVAAPMAADMLRAFLQLQNGESAAGAAGGAP